ncbi:hypothetical protein F5X97DRAFT_321287 [Nemania serpens]|nr:hypothetical protein F5X97DRAFT_321287 [Nemania serpens]
MATTWKTHNTERVALAKFSLATEDFTIFHVLSAQYHSSTDNTGDLDPVVDAHVKKIDTGTQKTIADAAATSKAKSAKIIDDAAASATAYIGRCRGRGPQGHIIVTFINIRHENLGSDICEGLYSY